jgi:hypothetical protein
LNDILIANIVVNGGNAANITPPSPDWKIIQRTDNDTNTAMASYYKVAGASEPSDYTWNIDSQTRAEGGITRYSGVSATNPIDTSAGNFGRGTAATTTPITTSSANEEVITLFGFDAGNGGNFFSTPAGMTEKYDVSNGPLGPSTAADDFLQTTAGSTGTITSTISGGKQRNWVAQVIALRAPSGRASPSVETGSYGPTNQPNSPFTSTATFTKSVSASSTLLIVHTDPNESLITGITYAGMNMALATTSQSGIATWYLVNPPIGTHDVVINYSQSVGGYSSAVSYTGTDTSSPFGAMSIRNGSGGDPAVGITTQYDNSVIDDNLFYSFGQSLAANPPQVQQLTINCPGCGNDSHGASTLQTGLPGPYLLGWTHGGASSSWIEIAVEIKGALL